VLVEEVVAEEVEEEVEEVVAEEVDILSWASQQQRKGSLRLRMSR
jgi:hypothetical protein